MPRYKLTIEYDGSPFCGWQRQANGPAVQQAIEEAIEAFCGHAVRIQGAGRTDTGVHARHQVAHVDLVREWKTDTVRDATNAHLKPRPVAILAVEAVGGEFNARTSAVKRHYIYRILNRRSPPALEAARVWHVPWPLETGLMRRGASHLIGQHDFTTFRASECQAKSPVRTLERLDVERERDEIRVYASARSFLHHQVRSMVGTLMLVGSGRMAPEEVGEILQAKDRSRCGPMAAACGLYLVGVDYPESGDPSAK
jgi:tRNA pseudouridine38-40 synthase